MLTVIAHCLRLLVLLFGGDQAVALENLALRHQLAIYKRNNRRPRWTRHDRWFWIVLSRLWKDWRRALVIVHPDSVLRWHRQRFRKYWSQWSSGRNPARPTVNLEVRELILRSLR